MKRKNHSLIIILAAAAVVLMAAWPQVSYSQFRITKIPKVNVKVPVIKVPTPIGPAISAGVHGYNQYKDLQDKYNQGKISNIPGVGASHLTGTGGLIVCPVDSRRTVPTAFVPSQAAKDYLHRETLYNRGVDALIKGDSLTYKSLMRRSSNALYPPAQYLYALTLLKDGDEHVDEAVDLLVRSAFSGNYGPAYYSLYFYMSQNNPMRTNCLVNSVNAACFDALVTAGFVSWEKGDTLNAEDCWWTAYRKELRMDSALNAVGKKRSAEYFRTYAERNISFVADRVPEMYDNLLWIKYSRAQTHDEFLDCLKLCKHVETKPHTPYVDWVLSSLYQGHGNVVPIDYTESMRYLKLAAPTYPDAKTALASMYFQGLGCDRDSAYASTLYEEAARDGSVEAMDMTARMYFDAKQWPKMLEWGTRPELSDSLYIQYLVGLAYVHNEECAKSIDYFARAADAGNTDAMWMAYVACEEVAPDDPRMMKYLEMAADAGNAEALNSLGYYYSYGSNVELDVAKAMQLFEKAKDAGCPEAYNNIGVLYYGRPKVDGQKLDRNRAATYWREGTEKGEPYSMYNYAMLLIKGRGGVKKDKSQGYALMRKAADMGVEEARQFMDKH